jgi:deoxyribonuclease V
MMCAVDVHYDPAGRFARAAVVGFEEWTSSEAVEERTLEVDQVVDYVPGEFYRRELPPVLEVLRQISRRPALVLVDGHVWLEASRPGLGARLHDALGGSVAVVGVAKTLYRGAEQLASITRGSSQKSLYVSAVGLDLAEAANGVKAMVGEHRIPSLLRQVDQLARGLRKPGDPPVG